MADDSDSRTANIGRKRAIDSNYDSENRYGSFSPEAYDSFATKRVRLEVPEATGADALDYDDEPDKESLIGAAHTHKQEKPMNVEDMPLEQDATAVARPTAGLAWVPPTDFPRDQDISLADANMGDEEPSQKQNPGSRRSTVDGNATGQVLSAQQLAAVKSFEESNAEYLCKGPRLQDIKALIHDKAVVLIQASVHPSKNEQRYMGRLHVGTARTLIMKTAAESGSWGLTSFAGSLYRKKGRFAIMFIYKSSDYSADAYNNFRSVLGQVESITSIKYAIEQDLQQSKFASFRDVLTEKYQKYREPVIIKALEDGRLRTEDYGGFQVPVDFSPSMLPNNTPKMASPKVKPQPSMNAHVHTDSGSMSEGEISEDEQADSALMTNIASNSQARQGNQVQDQRFMSQSQAVHQDMAITKSRIPGEGQSRRDTDDLRIDELNDNDRDLQELYYPPRSETSLVRCLACSLQGHLEFQCPSLVCDHCETRGDHYSHTCENRPDRDDIRKASHCTICNAASHTSIDCAWLWRTYNPDAEPHITTVDKLRVSCYECGSREHWGADCPFTTSQGGGLLGTSFSAEEANKYLVEPMPIPNARLPPLPSGAPQFGRKQHALPPRPSGPRGIAIKGTAPTGVKTSFDDDGIALAGSSNGTRASQRGGRGGMQMNIGGQSKRRDRSPPEPRPAPRQRGGANQGQDNWPPPPPPPPAKGGNKGGRGRGRGRGRGGRGGGARH